MPAVHLLPPALSSPGFHPETCSQSSGRPGTQPAGRPLRQQLSQGSCLPEAPEGVFWVRAHISTGPSFRCARCLPPFKHSRLTPASHWPFPSAPRETVLKDLRAHATLWPEVLRLS